MLVYMPKTANSNFLNETWLPCHISFLQRKKEWLSFTEKRPFCQFFPFMVDLFLHLAGGGCGCGSLHEHLIPFLNQAFTSSNALRRSSPYSLYCFVAARFSPRVHLDLEMELHSAAMPTTRVAIHTKRL